MNDNTPPEYEAPRSMPCTPIIDKGVSFLLGSQSEKSEPQSLTVAPFKFQQFHEERRLQVVVNPLDPRTGAVLGLDEMDELEALIQFIKNAPKVRE